MGGSSRACLLAFWLLMLPLAALHGQADRSDLRSEFALPYLPPPDAASPSLRHRWLVSPVTFSFPQLARTSGIIFSGTVMEIARRPASAGQSGETVSITFHIENAIRGATPGDALTITQWIGLWSSGQRYRVGERVLLFLYPPSKLGLTSCVGGSIGRFAVDSAGRVSLSSVQLSAFRRDTVLGGRSRVRLSDFALAVRKAGEEE